MPTVKPVPRRICAAQLRAARALLGWTQAQLSQASGVSVRRLKMLENAAPGVDLAPLPCRPATEARIREALESAGIAFADEGGAVAVARRI